QAALRAEGRRDGRLEQPGGDLAHLPRAAVGRLRAGAGVGAQAAGRWPRGTPGGRSDPGDLPVGANGKGRGTSIRGSRKDAKAQRGKGISWLLCALASLREPSLVKGVTACPSRARRPPITASIS